MNHATHTIGTAASVASRFGTENAGPIVRPEKLLDVLCLNNTNGTLYMQVFEIQNTQITASGAGTAGVNQAFNLQSTLSGGRQQWQSADTNYSLVWDTTNLYWKILSGATPLYTNAAQVPWEGTWLTVAGNGTAPAPSFTAPIAVAPAGATVPKFSFPVQPGLGGTLGRSVDMDGIFCAWSSTALTYTAAGSSGPIWIVVKG
jgi:hypothetical protein